MNKPSDSVRIVVFDNSNPERFLYLSESDEPNLYKLPGGKFANEHETPDVAAERELYEELQLGALQVQLVFAGKLLTDDGVSERYIYAGRVAPDAVRPSAEIHMIDWTTISEIPDGKNKVHMAAAVMCAATLMELQ